MRSFLPLRWMLLAASVLLLPTIAQAQDAGDEDVHRPAGLPWQSLEEAVDAADASDRKILLSIYAPWCGFCRKQNQEVFPDAAVGAFMREHFELARLNGDDGETIQTFRGHTLSSNQLALGFGVTGYPTVVFLDADGGYITRLPGFADADSFLLVLRFIATDAFQEMTFEDFMKASE